MAAHPSMRHPRVDVHHPLHPVVDGDPTLAIVVVARMIDHTTETDHIQENGPVQDTVHLHETDLFPETDLIQIDPITETGHGREIDSGEGMTIVDEEALVGVVQEEETDTTLGIVLDGEMIPDGGGAIPEEMTLVDETVIIVAVVLLQIDREMSVAAPPHRLEIWTTGNPCHPINILLHRAALTNTDRHILHDSGLALMTRVRCRIEKLALESLHQTLVVLEDIVAPYQTAMKTVVDRGNVLQYLEHEHPVTHEVPTTDAIQLPMNVVGGEARVLIQVLEVRLDSLC
jgi:hypothetical protein